MADVLAAPQLEHSFGVPLKRTTSQPSLLSDPDHHISLPNGKTDYKSEYRLRESRSSMSEPSSAPSSPQLQHIDFSDQPSYLSTPSSSLSLDGDCSGDDEEEGFQFPSYGSAASRPVFELEDQVAPDHSLPQLTVIDAQDITPSAFPQEATEPQQRPVRTSSVTLTSIADDSAVKPQPTRHVDYLSHDWKEEDIWSSWRHIVGQRGSLDNWERLENASWRTWMKSQKHLSTINPDRLNWMKDHDVTWLYGPLQTGSGHIRKEDTATKGSLSCNSSFLGKKPILKRRSASEIMLQRSISSQSLMRQATDSIRAQEAASRTGRPTIGARTYSDFVPQVSPVTSSNGTVPESPSPLASSASSGAETPDDGRHIHFNETVEQCIAISSGDEQDEENALDDEESHSSDEEFLTMKTDRTFERKLSRSNLTPRVSFSDGGGKTIAMLPTTTLKYRSDTPELAAQKQSSPRSSNNTLHQSSSQETLRPSRPSANYLLEDADDEDLDPEWQPSKRTGLVPCRDNLYGRSGGNNSPHPSQLGLDLYRDDNDELQHRGMRRTPSGMFMPYDEDEVARGANDAGLIGRVIDGYNTARDIAHVIWNVGWRR